MALSDPSGGFEHPDEIGRFEVREHVGSGQSALIYSAWDSEHERRVAIKLLRPERSHRRDTHARFLREAKTMARLTHPNIVQIYEVGMHEGQIFLALEYVEGRNFREWIEQDRPSIDEVIHNYLEAGRGLEAAHSAGIMHRDFKPENVLLGGDGRVRVLDFGLARSTRGTDSFQTVENQTPGLRDALAEGPELLSTFGVSGTPAYKSLEQHFGRPTDLRTDQFAYCVALWEALYGARPFAGRTAGEIARAIEAKQISPPPSARSSSVPRRLRKLLERGLEPERVDRYPCMGDLLAALEQASKGGVVKRLLASITTDKQ